MLMQSLGNSSAAEPTGFLEQNETLKTSPSEKTEMNIARVHLDEKTEVCKKNSALKYVWQFYLKCLFWENKWQVTWKADIED